MSTVHARRVVMIGSLLINLLVAGNAVDATPSQTFTVNTTAESDDVAPGNAVCADSGGKCSLRAALMEANARVGADTISLPAGTYTQTKQLVVDDDLVINGAARETTIIAGSGPSGAVGFYMYVTKTLQLNDVTLRSFPKAIYLSGTGAADVTINHSYLRDNVNTDTNSSGSALASYCARCTVTIHSTHIFDNRSPACGAISNYGSLAIDQSSQLFGNEATTSTGGALCLMGGSLAVTLTQFIDNHAAGAGSAFGGAVYMSDGRATFDHTSIVSGSATVGGAIYASAGSLVVRSTVIAWNSATTGGAMLTGPGAYATFDSSIIRNNTAQSGGAVFSYSFLDIRNSSVVSNAATTGGGVYINAGTATISNTTISGNTALQNGAGAYTNNDALLRLANVTVSNNTADFDDDGDGRGGGVYQDSSSAVWLKNSIVAGNHDLTASIFEPYAPDCDGALTSDGYNLIGLKNVLCTVSGNMDGVQFGPLPPGLDPRLGPLAPNYGGTYSHQPRFGPVIDRGNPAGCTSFTGAAIAKDQSGLNRPYGTATSRYQPRCDLGAIESTIERGEAFLAHAVR